jgi:hypothetical protein
MDPELHALWLFPLLGRVSRAHRAQPERASCRIWKFVHLLKDGGQQHARLWRVNPQELIPTLVHDGHTIGQSLAIIEYLDE